MAYTPEFINGVASICHEANRALCVLLGDDSQVPYDEAPENIQASARNGVSFVINNPEAPHSASHDNWLKFKTADGWVYGEEKCMEAKTHPCMVPYDQLPEPQRLKDALFKSIVLAFFENVTSSEPYGKEIPVTETINPHLEQETKAFEGDQLPLPSEPVPGAEEQKDSPDLGTADETGNVPPATDEDTVEGDEESDEDGDSEEGTEEN